MKTIPRAGTPLALPLLLAFSALLPGTGVTPARAETAHQCTGFIDAVPASISTQGVWCLRHDLSANMASGAAITLGTNNVTVDCNDFKVGGAAAGPATTARGIAADGRSGITIRNCNLRGFERGISLENGFGLRVADNRLEGNTLYGMWVQGDGSVVRGNLVLDTGGSTLLTSSVGIHVEGAVDVLDNTVDGVFNPTTNGFGIGLRSIDNGGGSIAGNRVRGLQHNGSGRVIGLSATGVGVLDVSNNVLVGDFGTSSFSMACSEPTGVRFRNNAIRGFSLIDVDCINAGGNDIP